MGLRIQQEVHIGYVREEDMPALLPMLLAMGTGFYVEPEGSDRLSIAVCASEAQAFERVVETAHSHGIIVWEPR